MHDRRQFLSLAVTLPLLNMATPALAQSGARYFLPPRTEWLPGTSKMRLLRDFAYRDPNGVIWTAKKGSLVDGASIPRFAWSVAGSPYDPPYRDASVIHDYYCDQMTRSWETTHRVFYDAMLTSNSSVAEARLKYFAVCRAGPRWNASHRWNAATPWIRVPRSGTSFGMVVGLPKTVQTQIAEAAAIHAAEASARRDFEAVRGRVARGELTAGDLPGVADNQIFRQLQSLP